MRGSKHARIGFALVELIVGAVTLAVVFAVLAAGVCRQRKLAGTVTCQMHLSGILAATQTYTNDQRFYPPSYVYGSSPTGVQWSFSGQFNSGVNGYVHWSGMYAAGGYTTSDEVYKCPVVPRGGAPAENPGPVAADWEVGQMDDLGMSGPSANATSDRQAKRMAYTANAMLLPRNKFDSGSVRVNRLVSGRGSITRQAGDGTLVGSERVKLPASTTIFTEFAYLQSSGPQVTPWLTLASISSFEGAIIKSQFPITPVYGLSAGSDVYNEGAVTASGGRFLYPNPTGIVSWAQLGAGTVLGSFGSTLNAVGRHHENLTANFAKSDGSVEQTTVQNSITRRLWGERFWSLTGGADQIRP